MPEEDEIFLDHVGFFAEDLDDAGSRLQRLGFQVSDVNVQLNADASERLAPSGTSNRLVKFHRGFLEVLAATGETVLSDQLRQGLARFAGLHVVALTHPDMDAQHRRLTSSGFALQPLVRMRRLIQTAEGERVMAYTILRTAPGEMPEGRVQMLTTHTPDLFWTSGVTDHANQADGLTDLLVCAQEPKEAARRFGRFTARLPIDDALFTAVNLDRGRILFAAACVVEKLHDRFSPPADSYAAGQAIRSLDMLVTGEVLLSAGVRPIYADADLICLGPEDGLGAYLLFHGASIAHPWLALARRV